MQRSVLHPERLASHRALGAPTQRLLRMLSASVALASTAAAQPTRKPAPMPPAPASAAATQGSTLDFANARLADVIRTMASMLGRTIVTSDVPDVRVTFSTAVPVKPSDLEGIFESLLESHDLMLVPKGNVAQVMPSDKAPATGVLRTGYTFPDPPRWVS